MTQQEARCPICGVPCGAAPGAAPRKHAPFCSSRCQLIDLGNWLGERYVIPSRSLDASADDPDSSPNDLSASDGEGDPRHDKGSP